MNFQKKIIFIFLPIVLFNCNGPVSHKIMNNYDDGGLKVVSIFQGSSKIQEIEFSNEGNILTRSFYKNNCISGKWTSLESFNSEDLVLNYYGNGELKSKGYLVNDNFHGHWSHYNRYGEIESNRYYFHGEPTGDWYSHHNNHIEVDHKGYIKGNGNWIEYYNADENISDPTKFKIKESSFFHDGKLTGFYEYYHKNGNQKISGYYENGKKDGQWNYYDENGVLTKTENYKSGFLDGDYRLFFDDGITEKLIGKYKNNNRTETWFWFFDKEKKSSHKITYLK